MNRVGIGALIASLRKERGMTQRQLADALHVSDKAVSKWECGAGCPDISLLHALGDLFGVPVERLLSGDLCENDFDGGNMKKIKFYVCPTCGTITTMTGNGEFFCCGRKQEPLVATKADVAHTPEIELVEDDYYLTFEHAMTKAHYLSFLAYVMCDRLVLVRLYPEQNAEVRLPRMYAGTIYYYCTEHGLIKYPLRVTK